MINDNLNSQYLLTVKQASALSHIGVNRLYSIIKDPGCDFCLRKGKYAFLIKKDAFLRWLDTARSI